MRRKRASKDIVPNEGYALPKSAEKGVPFIDFHAVLKDIIPKTVKIVKKKRVIILERRKDV